MDPAFLILLAAAVLILLLPWEHVTGVKAAGVEVTLERPQVKAALEALRLGRIENTRLREALVSRTEKLELVRGARVLWVDDRPDKLVGLRRLLRALGIEVASVTDSESAMDTLERDNDFDLMISDAQRGSPPDAREGARFALEIRGHPDPVIASLPIVFYTAWPTLETAERYVEPAMKTAPRPYISLSEETLLPQVIDLLAAARENPIPVAGQAKTAT